MNELRQEPHVVPEYATAQGSPTEFMPSYSEPIQSAYPFQSQYGEFPEAATEITLSIPRVTEPINEQTRVNPSTHPQPSSNSDYLQPGPMVPNMGEAPATAPPSEVWQEKAYDGHRFLVQLRWDPYAHEWAYIRGSAIPLGPVEQKPHRIGRLTHDIYEDGNHDIRVQGKQGDIVIQQLAQAAQSVASHAGLSPRERLNVVDQQLPSTSGELSPPDHGASLHKESRSLSPASASQTESGKANPLAEKEPHDKQIATWKKVALVLVPPMIVSGAMHNFKPLMTHMGHDAPFVGKVVKPSPYQLQRFVEPWSTLIDVYKGTKRYLG